MYNNEHLKLPQSVLRLLVYRTAIRRTNSQRLPNTLTANHNATERGREEANGLPKIEMPSDLHLRVYGGAAVCGICMFRK